MTWSLEQAYGEYPQIEEEFSAALDESLHPRGSASCTAASTCCPATGPEL